VRYTISFLKDYFNTTDPLYVCNLIIGMLFVVIGFSTYVLIHVIVLNIKIVKLVKFNVTSGVVTKLFLSVKRGCLIYLKY
jgi:hypothetical protein